jgi:hypothetical protein
MKKIYLILPLLISYLYVQSENYKYAISKTITKNVTVTDQNGVIVFQTPIVQLEDN